MYIYIHKYIHKLSKSENTLKEINLRKTKIGHRNEYLRMQTAEMKSFMIFSEHCIHLSEIKNH